MCRTCSFASSLLLRSSVCKPRRRKARTSCAVSLRSRTCTPTNTRACLASSNVIELRHIARPSCSQKALKLPGFSGIVTARTASGFTEFRFFCDKAQAVKFILAPQATATKSRRAIFLRLARPWHRRWPAHRQLGMARVSSNTSLIAGTWRRCRRGSLHRPVCGTGGNLLADLFDRNTVGEKPTWASLTRRPAFSDWYMASESWARHR